MRLFGSASPDHDDVCNRHATFLTALQSIAGPHQALGRPKCSLVIRSTYCCYSGFLAFLTTLVTAAPVTFSSLFVFLSFFRLTLR